MLTTIYYCDVQSKISIRKDFLTELWFFLGSVEKHNLNSNQDEIF